MAARNRRVTSMIGLGYYGTLTPAVVQRNVLENPAWYTAYTPYQPEISQGRLEALLNFQTVVSDLTGLPDRRRLAARRVHRRGRGDDPDAPLEQGAGRRGAARRRRRLPADARRRPDPGRCRCGIPVVVADLTGVDHRRRAAGGRRWRRRLRRRSSSTPAMDGALHDLRALTAAAHDAGALVTASADLLALTLATPPGEWGADVAVGTTQRFGVPMGFGGPHAGYMSVRQGLERTMPGRLVGVSVDAVGAPAYRLALQTREQHIRREKATSNICTAQVLLAVMASMYAVYHGPAGPARDRARRARARRGAARRAARGRGRRGRRAVLRHRAGRVPGRADEVVDTALARRGQPVARRRRHRPAQRRRDHRPGRPRRGSRRRSASWRPSSVRVGGAAVAGGAGAHLATTSPTRCSPPTTPRPRCCATCAASPTATSRSTAG